MLLLWVFFLLWLLFWLLLLSGGGFDLKRRPPKCLRKVKQPFWKYFVVGVLFFLVLLVFGSMILGYLWMGKVFIVVLSYFRLWIVIIEVLFWLIVFVWIVVFRFVGVLQVLDLIVCVRVVRLVRGVSFLEFRDRLYIVVVITFFLLVIRYMIHYLGFHLVFSPFFVLGVWELGRLVYANCFLNEGNYEI